MSLLRILYRNWAASLIVLHLFCLLGFYESAQINSESVFTADDTDLSTLLRSLRLPQNTEYEVVSPYEVDHLGQYISHQVTHRQRRRRSSDEAGGNAGTSAVHFRLQGLGQDFHLELQPSQGLVTPGLSVQLLGKNGTKSLQPLRHNDLCFYQGSLRAKVNSSVALSTCSGMSGLIRTQEGDYFLKPLPPSLAQRGNFTGPANHQPHILYKRSIQTDGRKDKWTDTATDPEDISVTEDQHLHHHHGNHSDYRHGTRQRQHFCGRRKKYMPKPPEEDLYIQPDEYQDVSRSRRAALLTSQRSQMLNVETLVVVDKKMMENHGHENITTYVLTVLNMVSTLFKDGTIGGNINIVIVGLILLDEEQDGLVINHHADHTLNSFCQWQAGLGGREGRRHDHAILLTGLDICSWKNQPCDTLGFAPISGMCSKYRSCTVNEDTGLGLAFTIAHESGHNFGMVHDGEGNMCKKSEGNIMSPTLAGHNGIFSWSACSRQYLSKFLSSAQSRCLSDEPQPLEEYSYPQQLPGELYDADTQCKWQFGEKAKLCTLDFKKDICKALWCHRVGRKCETKFMPAAEGSACGPEMWCRRGQCVKQGEEGPRQVHGQWSEWSGWSTCSRSCQSGITYRDRNCSNPKPMYGGKFCEGSSRSYKLCNTKDCPVGSLDYRAAQCAEFNSQQFRGWYYSWRPYTRVDDHDLCKLYCYADGYDFFYALSSKVRDGTLCSQDNSNVCIDGLCERAGCDRELGSTATPDVCGVCNGNNSTCKTYKGQYTKQHYSSQYYGVVTIPSGARSIRVVELNTSSSYLSVRNTQRRYYLNGQWTVDWPGRHLIAGALFDYKRPYNRPESLTSAGPTNETLVVEVLLQGWNPGIRWEYSMRKSFPVKHNYSWAIVRSQCSETCAGGQMNTKSACYKDLRAQVNTSYCNPRTKPATGLMPCNTQPCPASWSVGDWGPCSRTCGGGEQSRQVKCLRKISQYKMETVAEALCVTPRPITKQTCKSHTCPPGWSIGPWSQCSRHCGKGVRRRSVVCKSSSSPGQQQHILPDTSCPSQQRPSSQEPCLIKRCPKQRKVQWFISTWHECSVTCGRGIQTRFVKCAEKDSAGKYRELASKKCHHVAKPSVVLHRGCSLAECPRPVLTGHKASRDHLPFPRPEWYSSHWSECTVSCGGGVQVRAVQCLVQGKPSSQCVLHLKPPMSQACNMNFCPQPQKKDLLCKDYFNWCYLVPQHGVCSHKFYGKQCCKSCSHSNL
ncbi:A disintegrin and metalloproteinase with thrombospondin motifs 16 [Esox lucius]|uniref:ADAM metallopeptidase with thrombospondin type 1 motif, 16 n=1 Tax=Esox lucius TaxID=8010 RepID=A0A6Q2YL02_ESOLU|nr:A disintegrin and metalloproteinase with thrombospondin motifs 16 [Esox lucius]